MKKLLVSVFIASILMAGCAENVDNVADASVAASSEASTIVIEASPPESTASEVSKAVTNEKPRFEHDWQALYYDELTKPLDSSTAMFNIYDLDDNGTPELLISEASFHGAGAGLFTVNNGELVFVGGYGSWGEFQYDFERNYIHSSFFHMGQGRSTIYHFANGEAAEIISFYMYDGSFPETEPEFKINDEDVPEDVFDVEYEKYTFDFKQQEDFIFRKHDITQDTIESVLKEYS